MEPYRRAMAYKLQQEQGRSKRQQTMLSTIYNDVDAAERYNAVNRPKKLCMRCIRGDPLIIIRSTTDDSDDNLTLLCMLWQIFVTTQDDSLTLTAYFSLIYNMLPDKQNEIELIMDNNGIDIIPVGYPEEWETSMMVYHELVDDLYVLGRKDFFVILGICLLMPFKNSTLDNFEAFYKKRILTFSKMASASHTRIGFPLTLEKVLVISNSMNGFDGFKVMILKFALSKEARREARLSGVIKQVTRVLEWSDMTAFNTICEQLIDQGSPVLFDARVASETKRIKAALGAMSEADFPPFMRYLGPPDIQGLFESNNYPTLYAVAQELAAEKSPSMRQLVMTRNVNRDLIKELMAVHQNYAATTMKAKLKATTRYADVKAKLKASL